ncbi:MAG: hypothetical protein C4321_03090, partial [Chloroflexota bacterium]
ATELMRLAEEAGVMIGINEQGGLRFTGRRAEDFVRRHQEALIAAKGAILAILRGEPESLNPRMEFARAYQAKIEGEIDQGVPEWLEWAFCCLFNDAMQAFVRWGLGDSWTQVRDAASNPLQARGMRERALERWTKAHLERERHRYSARWGEMDDYHPAWRARRDELAQEAELWAWRAYLLEIARRNPEATQERDMDLWADLRPWALWLHRNGRANGLVWSDREAA